MHDLLKNLVERLHEAAHSNLESVILYGPAAQMGSADTATDLHVLCTLHSLDLEELARISPVVHWWTDTHKQPAPLFFTSAELQHAADVFSIELVDMQASHRVLYGADVVSNMVIPMNLHRVQVEYEFRTTLLKLRQHFLLHPGNFEELRNVLEKSFPTVFTLLRHTLIALDRQVPSEPREVLAQTAAATGADANSLLAVLQWRETQKGGDAVLPTYGAYLAALEKVILALDQHLPKHQWQRAHKATSS